MGVLNINKRGFQKWPNPFFVKYGNLFFIRLIGSYMHFMLGNSTTIKISDTQHLNINCIISYFGIFPFFKAFFSLQHI